MNWHKVPFVRILLPFLLGILPATLLSKTYFPQSFYLLCFLIPGLLFLHRAKIAFPYRKHFGIFLYFFLFLLGYQHTFFYLDQYQPNHFQHFITKSNWVEGNIIWSKTGQKSIQLAIEVKRLGVDSSSSLPSKGNLLVYLPKEEFRQDAPLFGDQLLAQLKVSKFKSNGNPKAFDFKTYLNQKNIFYQAYSIDSSWTVKPLIESRHPLRLAGQLQRNALLQLKPHLPQDEEWSVAKALILGHRDDTNQQVKKAYAATGAMHVLAVSGLHVGIIVFLLNSLLFFIPNYQRWKWFKTLVILIAIWAFAFLTGASASVLRATTMFSFLLIGYTLNKTTNIYNTLAASAFFLLLINPLMLFDIGFQLSYSAILGIIYFQPKLYGLIKVSSKLVDYAWKLLTVSIAAQISTAAISIFYFHQFPSYFWLSGLLIIPAAAIILGSGFLIFFSTPFPALQFFFGKILLLTLKLSNQFIFFIEQLPGSLIENIWINPHSVFVYYLLIFGIIYAIDFKQFKGLLFSLLCSCILTFSYAHMQWELHQGKVLFIYNVPQYSLIDIFNGRDLISIRDEKCPKEKEFWPTKNNRNFHNSKNHVALSFDAQFSSKTPKLQYKDQVLYFFGYYFLILDENSKSLEKSVPLINYVLLRHNSSFSLDQIAKLFPSACLIFDSSNSTFQVLKWKAQCQELDLKYIDLRTSGAFQLKL